MIALWKSKFYREYVLDYLVSRGVCFCIAYFRLKYSSVYIQRKSLESDHFLSEWYSLIIFYSPISSNKEKKVHFCNKALSLFFENTAKMPCLSPLQIQYLITAPCSLLQYLMISKPVFKWFVVRSTITVFEYDWNKGPKQSLMCGKWRVSSFFGRKVFPYQQFHCVRMGTEGKIIPFLLLLNIIFSVISVSQIVFSGIEMWILQVSNPYNELNHSVKLS